MTPTLCIVGASGDLTSRLLLPGLGTLLAKDTHRRVRIVGCDRIRTSADEWQSKVAHAFSECGVESDSAAMQAADDARWFTVDVSDGDSMKKLFDDLSDADRLVLYFAVPPKVSQLAVDTLLTFGVPEGTQLAFEKPFGGDLAGAKSLNTKLLRLVRESDIHRVDHFLGQSTVLNLVSLRFANRLFAPVWNGQDVASVEIIFDEGLTLEGRAGYYDQAGAMVDMLQSHLLQVMALTLMEPPARIDEIELRAAISTVLRSAQPWNDDPAASSRRARYVAGRIDDRDVPNYLDEPGVDRANDTETLAQITLEVRNARWAGVPITLRSGKSIGQARKQILVNFNNVRHLPEGLEGHGGVDQFIIDMDPDRLSLRLTTNTSDNAFGLRQSVLSTDLRQSILKPYGEVLAGILDGDPILTVRGDAAEECWRIIEAFRKVWHDGEVPMQEYSAGSAGPDGWI